MKHSVFSGWSRSSDAASPQNFCKKEEQGSPVKSMVLSPRDRARHSGGERINTGVAEKSESHQKAVLLSPRNCAGNPTSIAEKLRRCIADDVLAGEHAGQVVVSSALPVLPSAPNLPGCDLPTGGELERAEKVAAYVQKLQSAARHRDADDSERELLLGLCDFLTCVTEQLTQHPRTEISKNLDDGIRSSAEKHMVPTIRKFVSLEAVRAKVPAFSEMEKRLADVQRAEDACQGMADVRGRKQALQKVWNESLRYE
jgi:hypothetical protein